MTTAAPARPHWLQQVGAPCTPATLVTFDTETKTTIVDGDDVMTLRCWDATIRMREHDPDGADKTFEYWGETAGGLVDVIETAITLGGETWVFAHNVGFDLTVTSLPMILVERGWESKFVNIGDESCVFSFAGPTGRLVITDSWSWLRCSLATAAADVGMRKTRLPKDVDDLAAWHRRCRHDVKILDALLSELLDWWDRAELGAFAVTSSSCGWRSLRAKTQPKTVLVGPDPPRTGLEREAVFGGRKEVWRVGTISGCYVDDWDLVAAHLTTVRHLPLPCRPLHEGRLTGILDALEPPGELGTVCKVKITTRTPCAPVRVGQDVWWPTGRFVTTLTSAELVHVREVADQVELLEASWYWLTDDLAPWAEWCDQLRAGEIDGAPNVAARVARGWGRSVIGRFALRTSTLVGEREATHTGWSIESGHDLDTGLPIEIITYGGVERTYLRDRDGRDVSPVVLAFVEGYVRAGMGRIIAQRRPENMLQVNTDGWWEIRAGRGEATPDQLNTAPWALTKRETARSVTVHGPNHLTTPTDRRLAGIPADAQQALNGSYKWHDWPGLRWQLQNSRPGEYKRPGRELLLQDHYCRRWVLKSGETVPATTGVRAGGETVLMPWSRTYGRLPGDVLASHQVPALSALADAGAPAGPALLAPPARPLGRA